MYHQLLNRIRTRSLLWDTITTTGWSTAAKAVGFLIPFFIAAWFGVSAETDAFFFAYGLILFLSSMFAPAIESVIVPYIAEAKASGSDIGQFVGSVLGISGISLLLLTGAALLVIKPVLSVITHFDPMTLDLIYWLLIETAPLIILLVWTSVLSGTLNAYKRFAIPAISPAFRAVINLGIIYSFKDALGVHAIPLGYVAGEASRLLILTGIVKRLNLFNSSLPLHLDSRIREFLGTASYQVMGMAVIGLNPIVDKTMTSWLGKGSVSLLYYADILYMIPVTFLSSGLLTALLSHWSSRHYNGQAVFKNDVNRTIRMVLYITIPLMLILVIFHKPIVDLVLARGAFNHEKLTDVGWVWVCYLFGLAPYMGCQIFNRMLLVQKRTSLLFFLSLIWVCLNVLFNMVLMRFLAVAGIALSTSLVYLIAFIILFFLFREELVCNAASSSKSILARFGIC